jgi:hypothetical protein
MPPLSPENSGCKAQRGGAGGAMFKRCNTANAVFKEQPKGLVSVSVHFCVARHSHAMLHHPNHSSRLELHKNGYQRGHE